MSDYLKRRRDHINAGRPETERIGHAYFTKMRIRMTGKCACGCNRPSEKHNDLTFHCSIAHIFPQRLFGSIADHPSNFVERAWRGGCHDNMDNGTVWDWPMFADWQQIVEAFYELSPLLSDTEKATKFYKLLEKVVQSNP